MGDNNQLSFLLLNQSGNSINPMSDYWSTLSGSISLKEQNFTFFTLINKPYISIIFIIQ